MKTCSVTVRVYVGRSTEYGAMGDPTETRTWKGLDIMKLSHTYGWATRQFNVQWSCRKRDVPIRVEWECRHDDGNYRGTGSLSGVNSIRTKRGIFE
jgi:hypothetical protein